MSRISIPHSPHRPSPEAPDVGTPTYTLDNPHRLEGRPYTRLPGSYSVHDYNTTLENVDATLEAVTAPALYEEASTGPRFVASVARVLKETRAALVEDLSQEQEVSAVYYRFLGNTAVRQALEQTSEIGVASGPTLAKSVAEAKKGNADADARVTANVNAATVEAFFRDGQITEVKKELNDKGEVVQLGLTTEAMHRDSIVLRPHRPKKLKQFTLAEARNGFREQQLVCDNELQEYWFIAASCVPEDLPEAQLGASGDGYFTRSMAYSVQGTTQEGTEIITQTVFDRGTDANEYASYEERQAQRFDLAAIGKVYEWLGFDAPQTALEMLERPLRIPKRLMPNGMADFWRWVDMAADEIRGQAVVRTEQEYIARIERSRERETSLAGVRQEIKEALLELEGTFESDMDAIDALWELARTHGAEESITNNRINPMVFGVQAAHLIQQARSYMRIGDQESATLLMEPIKEVAEVSGCGGGSCGLVEVDVATPEGAAVKTKLDTQPGEVVVRDTERACGGCGEKGGIFYAYTPDRPEKRVKKYCSNCEAKE